MQGMTKVTSEYEAAHTLEERRAECARLMARHPGMVPVVCEPAKRKGGRTCHTAVPAGATVAQLAAAVRAAADIDAGAPLSLLAGGAVPPSEALVGDLYERTKATDGFLYVTFAAEGKFGNPCHPTSNPCFKSSAATGTA